MMQLHSLIDRLTGPLLFFTAVLIVLAGAILAVRRYRDRAEQNRGQASDALSNFRELHARGDLSDEEYRTIKTVLAAKLQKELNKTGD